MPLCGDGGRAPDPAASTPRPSPGRDTARRALFDHSGAPTTNQQRATAHADVEEPRALRAALR
ncbi:hypothetical protein AB0I00_27170 [Streptomyces sp. NPDC050803]|uniref:hypothetical protein n=1 Tax=unclassified Streptomyces TaxID=2593676 RepID=UPI0034361C68